ncbi:MAG TPA: carbamoyltransferase N-terminal domain-containing protein, partial [Chitinophagales bacterium]|nr:carbamoyltransferase N-terminal domain-containing protein [Chitinophagales bacterium]
MIVLGINGGFRGVYQDVSAVLVRDGRVVAAIEEERLSRIKFSPGRLPYLSVLEVLKIGKVSIREVDMVAFHGSTWDAEIDPRLQDYFRHHFGFAPPIKRYHHHDCHAVSTFFSSGFKDALIVTLDNSGDGISAQVSTGKGTTVTNLKRFARPNSFGVFYSLFTQYCGFVKDKDEYKLMGLAAYGNRQAHDFSWLLQFENGELKLNTGFIKTSPPGAPSLHRDEMIFNSAFEKKMGAGRRIPTQPLTPFYKDIAASAQNHLDETVLKMLKHYVDATGLRKICLAGGVGLNCLMNQRVMDAPFVERLYVHPASSDAGISMGAAFLACLENGITPAAPDHVFLGNEFSNEEIWKTLKNCNTYFEECSNPAESAAQLVARNQVIGWFQGRMEFGPRALGNRSILANPAAPDIQSAVNNKIKFRDSFRPFGASVLEEDMP